MTQTLKNQVEFSLFQNLTCMKKVRSGCNRNISKGIA